MNKLQRFLYGQHFADGLRTAVLIVLPAIIASYFSYFDIGLSMSIGAMCVSISDTPGPALDKRNAMMVCSALIPVMAILTGFMRMNVYVMGAGLTFFAFFFAMFTMYGARAGLLGTSILLLMVLEMEKELTAMQIIQNAFYLGAGAVWYSLVSILILSLYPYRAAQRALGECVRETAGYLSLRGNLYDVTIPIEVVFAQLMAQQVILSDKQNEVRDLLFKNNNILRQSTPRARSMIVTFDELVDLYERITASHIEYTAIRERYAKTTVLQDVTINIKKLAEILDGIGAGIQYNTAPKHKTDISIPMSALADTIAGFNKTNDRPVLNQLLTNIQSMYDVVTDLQHYFTDDYPQPNNSNKAVEHTRFVTHLDFDPALFRYNLTFDSLTFRHSVRMALACLTGFVLSKVMMHGHHSYWLLITIIFVLKPAFSLTRERNIQRITGTLIGGVIGILILTFIHNTYALFACMFAAMLLTYSFQRHKYRIAVIFMTPYILILFHFMHVGLMEVAEERVVDTIVGSIIALVAGYLILPDWESNQIKGYMSGLLHANYRYLMAVRDSLSGANVPITEYKLIRKDVYVNASNLSAAIQRMNSEPIHTQKNTKEIQKFSLLNHVLTSHIAGAKESISGTHQEDIDWVAKSLTVLDDTIQHADDSKKPDEHTALSESEMKVPPGTYGYIYKTAIEIRQIAQSI